jgi:hypothetical protein
MPIMTPSPPVRLGRGNAELPLYGVLRSSAWSLGVSKGTEGDVVLLLPALPYEGVEFLKE